MIVGEEPPDDGQVLVDAGITIGYFSQDVDDMSGQSVVAAVMDGGAGERAGRRMAQLEAAMVDPDQADELDALVERYGEVQGRFEDWTAMRWMRGRARCWRARASARTDGRRRRLLSGGWKMRVALAASWMRPTACCSTSRATISTWKA